MVPLTVRPTLRRQRWRGEGQGGLTGEGSCPTDETGRPSPEVGRALGPGLPPAYALSMTASMTPTSGQR